MKKIFIGTMLVIVALVGMIAISIALIDDKKIYEEFVQTSKIDISAIETSNFKLIKFPMPYLVIDEIKQNGKITLKNIEIRFSLMSILQFNPRIVDLKIREATIHLKHDNVNFLKHDEFISELISKNIFSTRATIDKLIFIESDEDIPLVINKLYFVSTPNMSKFTGEIDAIGNLEGSFVASGDDVLFKLNAKDTTYDLSIEEIYKNKVLDQGKFTMETSNISHFLIRFLPDFLELSQPISSDGKVQINFDILPSSNHIILKNIKIISDAIAGTGQIDLGKENNYISDIKLDLTKLDVFRRAHTDEKIKHVSNKSLNLNNNYTKINVSIKDITLDENNALNDVNIQATIKDGNLYIQELVGKIDQSGQFHINGIVSKNSFRSLFNGKIVLNHKDLNDLAEHIAGVKVRTDRPIPFALSSDIKMSSVDISLQNLLIKTNDIDVEGDFSTKFVGNSSKTNANIKFSFIDIDNSNFPAVTQAFNYATSLFDKMKEEDYLSKFIPIRKINSVANYDITFNNLHVHNKLYKNVNFSLETAPGKILLNQLRIQNGDDWVETNISLEAQAINPKIYIGITDGSLGVKFLSAPAMLDLRNKMLENLNLSKIDIALQFYINKLYQDDLVLNNVSFHAQNNKNLFDITKFDADLLGGRMQSSGSILLDPYTLNFVYAINSAHIAKIAELLPKGMVKSGGVLSASGMWVTHGDNLDELLYNLYTKSNVMAKDITIQNFSIDDLIQNLGVANYNILNLKDDVKKAMLTKETKISELKSNIDFTKGTLTLSDLVFKTKYSTASGSLLFNLYNFNLDSSVKFSFYLSQPRYGRSPDNTDATMAVTASGYFLSPKKTPDTKALEEVLQARLEK